MTINISQHILGLKGQRVNEIKLDDGGVKIVIHCSRDARRRAIDPATGQKGSINQHVRRQVNDIPLFGYPCVVEIELAQVYINKGERRIEGCDFVDKGCRFTHRFCRLISGLCRHMSIQAVSRHLDIRWETVKNIDRAYLIETLPTAEVFSRFLKQLQPDTACKIKAVAMDMGPAYQKAVRESLPLADIVFDRFHVMKNYSKAIHNQRRLEFRKADPSGKELMKGTHYLLLKNADKLSEKQSDKLQRLLESNSNLNALYVLKEQLQLLWSAASFEAMAEQLERWCLIADQSQMLYLKKFAKSLRKHCVGICNYAKHKLTSARIEAGNVSIGMIRKRARGIKDTEYFKLKIRQSSIPDNQSMLYLKS